MSPTYTGRFAPSPTGPLHFGSLVSAIGSFLQARCHQGRWHVRIEDLDPIRERPGSNIQILKTLERFGLHWDGQILYQSQRHFAYLDAIEYLIEQSNAYVCNCTRREIRSVAKSSPYGWIYPGSCRNRKLALSKNANIRVKTDNKIIGFVDENLGHIKHNLQLDLGDFVIKRRDGHYTYQLAVVIDDAYQAITQVVRGADLLDSTTRQIYLQRLLGLPGLQYLHLPVATDAVGKKLSKQTHAAPLNKQRPLSYLVAALHFLNQNPPDELIDATLDEFWQWAIKNWSVTTIPNVPAKPCESILRRWLQEKKHA